MQLRMPRRRFLWFLGGAAAALVGARFGLPYLLRPRAPKPLSPAALALVEQAFAGIDRAKMWDGHVHLVGLGAGGTGCFISPEMRSHLHPVKRLQFDVYVQSLGMTDPATADADYVIRLLALHRGANPAGRLVLLPFDHFVDENGVERPERSHFYTPNDYALRLARQHPEFVGAASIHPYRHDAVERLDAAVEDGARAVKWLPNAMGIDPASPLCLPFYRRLAETGLPLVTHGGSEYAVDGSELQELGNPLRLRPALDAGVRVVVAHCASLGESLDLDAGGTSRAPSLDLLLRLFDDPAWSDRLFADISALTQINRDTDVIDRLLRAEHLHPRLVNASDYPIPALRILYSTTWLHVRGLIDRDEAILVDEIAAANPLLFDFVLKRRLRVRDGAREYRFADSIFETDRLFRPSPVIPSPVIAASR